MSEKFTNARVYEHLTPALDDAVTQMHTTRLQLNSAALWWFLNRLSAEERAELLGEYVKLLAMHGQAEAARRAGDKGPAGGKKKAQAGGKAAGRRAKKKA
jgi:hypothetical protein